MADGGQAASSYLDHLPAMFREGGDAGPGFLGRYLLAFEQVLTGVGDPARPGLEEKLDGIAAAGLAGVERHFEPGPGLPEGQRAPTEFLEWLAGWVAIAFRADVDELRRRELIARAVPLYRLRGTKQGLAALLGIYTRMGVSIDERTTRFQVGVHSRVGVDTVLEGGAPHHFRVTVRLPLGTPEEIHRQRQIATAVVDAEKPAHTHYELDIETPVLQVGVTSRVGVDTLLGEPSTSS